MSIFSERLSDLIESSCLKKMDIANDVGISPGELTKYLSGERKPGIEVLNNLATALNVTTDYLLGNDDSKTKNVKGVEACVEAYTRNKDLLSKEDALKLVNILMKHINKDET